jgi:hypothetical protein
MARNADNMYYGVAIEEVTSNQRIHCSQVCIIASVTQRGAVGLSYVQGIHKRMVRFQKLTRNVFLILHGHNLQHQQRQLSKFLMR